MNVLIAGAGVIGASIAYHLALRGVAATVIERSAVANAASGKSGGFLARDWCEGTPQDALARVSFDLHQDLAQTLGNTYGYRRLDTYALEVSHRRGDGGVGPRLGSSVAMQAPSLDWVDGRCRRQGRIGSVATTAQVQPALFTHALLDAAVARGARLRKGCVEGLDIDTTSGRLNAVWVDGDPLAADAVVIAMGPWSILAAQWARLPAVYGLKGYSIAMRPQTTLPAEALFVDYEDSAGERHGPEIVPRADGEVYMCGFSDQSPLPLSPDEVVVDESACARLHQVAGMVSSTLGGAPVLRTQACYRPICRDAMPIMGELAGSRGVYVASGHNCWGMLNAPASGLALAELLCDGHSHSVDLTPFDPQRLPAVQVRLEQPEPGGGG